MFNSNVGSADKIVRIVAGLILAILPFVTAIGFGGALGYILVAVGIVLVATAVLNFCPLYAALGLSTKAKG